MAEPGWTYARRRYAILFYSLLATLAATPLLAALHLDADLLEFFLALNLVMGVLGLERGWGKRFLLAATAAVLLINFVFPHVTLDARPVALAFWTAIALLSAAIALRYALRSEEIGSEHIYAALSAYLLGGIFFGVLYHAVEQAWPGSITTSGQATGISLSDAVYFSFVTLATLGYGDVVPVNGVARGLAVIEAIIGQLFLAVMIARLVGSYAQGSGRRGK
jgi:voltage-gated potassium channel